MVNELDDDIVREIINMHHEHSNHLFSTPLVVIFVCAHFLQNVFIDLKEKQKESFVFLSYGEFCMLSPYDDDADNDNNKIYNAKYNKRSTQNIKSIVKQHT